MKRDQYIPHDVSMRTTTEVMNLIEKEGAAGYGFFWALMEYLRAQNGYLGDIRAVRTLARQTKIRMDKALRVLNDYGLFVVENATFHSLQLDERMKEFDRKRAQCEAYKRRKDVATVSETPCNSLSVSEGEDPISLIQPQEQPVKQPQPPTTTNAEPDDDGVDDVVPTPPVTLAWERYVDELRHEQSWIEIQAMRSGLKQVFVQRFGEILHHFKQHVQAVGNEKDIQSPSDAKRYFCFYNTPGSAPFLKLVAELQKPKDRGKYKHEDRDPTTGQRSYCGVPIPADAPPRPNAQAAWCEEKRKWIF